MINPIEVYSDAGTRAAWARHNRDESTARHFEEWARRAFRLESSTDRAAAEQAFRDAYRTEAQTYFRNA